MLPADRASRLALALAFLAYLLLVSGSIRTFLPWCDEGWFADPAYNLITRGSLGTSVLDPSGTFSTFRNARLEGLDRHTYWIMPVHPLLQAAWYKLAGFGLFQMRALSALAGAVALFAWFVVVRRLTGDPTVALAAFALLAVDFQFVWAASVGRMDILCVGFGLAALAVYLTLRETHFRTAVLASNTLLAAALFTHPNSILLFFDLCLLALWFDRRRLRPAVLALAAAPYLAGLAGWGLYILQSPPDFLSQFSANAQASNRYAVLLAPWNAVRDEFLLRYGQHFGLPPYSAGASRLKLFVLACYFGAALLALALPGIRRDRRARPLLLIAFGHILLLPLIDGFHKFLYLVYVMPAWTVLLALVLVHLWRKRPVPRAALAALAAALVLVQAGVLVYRMRQDPYHNRYLAAARFLKAHAGPGQVIMGSSELGFELGFGPRLVDDYRLGFRSGRHPDFVAVDEPRYAEWIARLQESDPAAYRHTRGLLAKYTLVYDRAGYRIYAAPRSH